MRKPCAALLTMLLACPDANAAGPDSSTPLSRSIAAEATRLASDHGTDGTGWQAVVTLEPATPVSIVTAAATVNRLFVSADDLSVTVLNAALPALPEPARRELLEILQSNPSAIAGAAAGGSRMFNDVTIGPDGVFFRNRKVAERGEIVARVPKDRVEAVLRGPRRKGDPLAALGGTMAGVLVSMLLVGGGGAVAFDRPGASGYVMALGVLVGPPVALGYSAWYASSDVVEDVIYRAPLP